MWKKIVATTLFAALALSVTMASAAGAGGADRNARAIIVFKDQVTPDDVKGLEGMGALIRHKYSIINGVAVEMPQAALDRLVKMHADPADPGSDPVAGRISYIENDGVMYALGDEAVSPEPATSAALVMPAGNAEPGHADNSLAMTPAQATPAEKGKVEASPALFSPAASVPAGSIYGQLILPLISLSSYR